MFVSYAQNFEDVILWRALKHVDRGFYIDIGAQDPVIDSVSLGFYEQGWRGVSVEPVPAFAAKLRAARPDEIVIEAAVSATPGTMPFFEVPDTGLSTGSAELAQAAGLDALPLTVSTISLAELLDRFGDRDVHWMKVDVEGMEADVLDSWDGSRVRPWVVVVEATAPRTQTATHATWDPALQARGYDFVYFDGLSRFYVRKELEDIKRHFGPGPNIFDDFSIAGTSTSARNFARLLLEQRDLAVKQLCEFRAAQKETFAAAVREAVHAVRLEASDNRVRLDAALAATRGELARLSSALAAARAELAEMSAKNARQEAALGDMETELQRAKAVQARIGAALAKAESEIFLLRTQAAQERSRFEAELAAARAETQGLRASTSWRLTAPLRWLGVHLARLFRSILHGGTSAEPPASRADASQVPEQTQPAPSTIATSTAADAHGSQSDAEATGWAAAEAAEHADLRGFTLRPDPAIVAAWHALLQGATTRAESRRSA